MNNESLILDLPPAPPAYIEVYESVSASPFETTAPILKDDDGKGKPPVDPPHGHDHEHADETPREPIRVNVSETLSLSESLTAELMPGR
jgi:hypothetical protein